MSRHGLGVTKNMNAKKARIELKKGLRSKTTAYIYHCYNHYMVPIGYEETSFDPTEAYGDGKKFPL